MTPPDTEHPVTEGPKISAETWFALALAGVIITFIVFTGVAIWVFSSEPELMQRRAQTFTPFGAAMIALVTFLTIAWRGVLNTKQLEYQAAQLAQQGQQLELARKQNDSKDDETLAKLLMEGTKLLGEEKLSHILAGVAILQSVAVAPRAIFASQAMDILVDLIKRHYHHDGEGTVFEAAREAVNAAADLSRYSSRSLHFDFSKTARGIGRVVRGVAMVQYTNAEINAYEFPLEKDWSGVRFSDCVIDGCSIEGRLHSFAECEFVDCEIHVLSTTFLLRNDFRGCDFSGARFEGRAPHGKQIVEFQKLKSRGNYFEVTEPIANSQGIPWERLLLVLTEEEGIDDRDAGGTIR